MHASSREVNTFGIIEPIDSSSGNLQQLSRGSVIDSDGSTFMESFFPYLCIAGAAFLTTVLLVPPVKKLAIKLDAVDYPSKRRINTVPTPRMGGLAVFAGLVVALLVQVFGTRFWGWPAVLVSHPSLDINYYLIAIAFCIIVITGAVDDVISLKPWAKLGGQIIAAMVAAAGGLTIGRVVNPFDIGYLDLGWLAYPITVIYLVAYANIINLIDGLDGLATGISGIASITMFGLAALANQGDAAALSIATFGACLAFLIYNFHPASIFLGDSGALSLGFSLGTVSLLSVSRTAALTSLLIPLVVAGVPIIDTFAAIVRRKRAHVSIGQADKGHIQHRLIQEGYDQRQAVLLIYAWCILLSLGATIINQVRVGPRIVVFLILLGSSAVFAVRLHLFEPVLRHHYNPKTKRDEIIMPEDPAFVEEEQAERRERAMHREERRGNLDRLGSQLHDAIPPKSKKK